MVFVVVQHMAVDGEDDAIGQLPPARNRDTSRNTCQFRFRHTCTCFAHDFQVHTARGSQGSFYFEQLGIVFDGPLAHNGMDKGFGGPGLQCRDRYRQPFG